MGVSGPPGPEEASGLTTAGLVGIVGCVVAALTPGFATGTLAVQIRAELEFGEAALGGAVAAFFAIAAVSSIPLGRLSQRYGAAAVLRGAGVGSAVSLLGIAVAARSLWSLIGMMLIGGAAMAAAQPAANMLISQLVPLNRQGRVLGLKQAGIPISTLCGGLAVPIVALTVGWRWSFVGAAVFALAAALLVPASKVGARAQSRSSAAPDAGAAWLLMVSVALALGSAATTSLAAFSVQGAVTATVSSAVAGYLVAVGSAGAICTYVLAGSRADTRPGGELLMVAAMLSVGAASLLLLSRGLPSAYHVGVPVAYAIGWGWPGLLNLAVVRRNPSAAGRATGATQTGAYAGAVLGPPGFGALAETYSYSTAWLTAACCSFAAAVILVRVPRTRPSARI